MNVRIVTSWARPRGDVVHAVSLAEALGRRGHSVELWALAPGGGGFFRSTEIPTRVVPVAVPDGADEFALALAGAAALGAALRAAEPADVHHAEDIVSALALLTLRDEGRIPSVVRTIHHVDAVTNPGLIDWQRRSIADVDHRLCVSRHWADRVEAEFGVGAYVVANGVDAARFTTCPVERAEAGRRFGWGERPVVLAVGGIEPRKGSRLLLEGFARARGRLGDGALLAIAGGQPLSDAGDYRDAWWRDADRLGLTIHDGRTDRVPGDVDVVLLGAVDDAQMPVLYRAADALAFPSTREGFGLVVLEAIAAGIPAIVTDLPVLREYLEDGRDCLMVPGGDSGPLSNAIVSAVRDEVLRNQLRRGGRTTVARFTWETCAAEHEFVYRRIIERAAPGVPAGEAG